MNRRRGRNRVGGGVTRLGPGDRKRRTSWVVGVAQSDLRSGVGIWEGPGGPGGVGGEESRSGSSGSGCKLQGPQGGVGVLCGRSGSRGYGVRVRNRNREKKSGCIGFPELRESGTLGGIVERRVCGRSLGGRVFRGRESPQSEDGPREGRNSRVYLYRTVYLIREEK